MERPVNGKLVVCWVLLALCIIALWTVFYWLPPPQQEEGAATPQQEKKSVLPRQQEEKRQEPQFVELPAHLHYLRDATVRISAASAEGSSLVVRQEGDDTYILTLGYVIESCRWLKMSETGEETTGFYPAGVVFHQENGEDRKIATILRYSGHDEPALLRASYGKCVRPVAWSDGIDVVHVNAGPIAPGTTAGRTRPEQRMLGGIAYDQYYAEMGVAGSGGGGIFLKDGKCLGLLSRCGGGLTLAIPTAAIQQWATDYGVAWAIDHTIPVPSEEKLKKLPVWIPRN